MNAEQMNEIELGCADRVGVGDACDNSQENVGEAVEMDNLIQKLGTKLAESLSPEILELLRVNQILIPIVLKLGPKLVKKIRPEQLQFLLANRNIIPLILKSTGIATWITMKAACEMEKPYIGSILG